MTNYSFQKTNCLVVCSSYLVPFYFLKVPVMRMYLYLLKMEYNSVGILNVKTIYFIFLDKHDLHESKIIVH